MNRRDASWSDALGALRARQWIHFAALPLAATFAGGSVSAGRAVAAIGVASSLLAYAYGANAIADRGTDTSVTKNVLAGVSAVPLRAALVVVAAGAVALVGSISLGGLAFGAASTVLVVATVYSLGPRWKATPIVGTLLNLFLFAPLALLAFDGVGAALASRPLDVRLAAFAPMLLQNQLIHELADVDEDARAGAVTTARMLGHRNVRIACGALGALGVVASFAVAEGRAVLVAALSLAAMTAIACASRAPAATRALHRRAGLVAGAVVFLASGAFES